MSWLPMIFAVTVLLGVAIYLSPTSGG